MGSFFHFLDIIRRKIIIFCIKKMAHSYFAILPIDLLVEFVIVFKL